MNRAACLNDAGNDTAVGCALIPENNGARVKRNEMEYKRVKVAFIHKLL